MLQEPGGDATRRGYGGWVVLTLDEIQVPWHPSWAFRCVWFQPPQPQETQELSAEELPSRNQSPRQPWTQITWWWLSCLRVQMWLLRSKRQLERSGNVTRLRKARREGSLKKQRNEARGGQGQMQQDGEKALFGYLIPNNVHPLRKPDCGSEVFRLFHAPPTWLWASSGQEHDSKTRVQKKKKEVSVVPHQ